MLHQCDQCQSLPWQRAVKTVRKHQHHHQILQLFTALGTLQSDATDPYKLNYDPGYIRTSRYTHVVFGHRSTLCTSKDVLTPHRLHDRASTTTVCKHFTNVSNIGMYVWNSLTKNSHFSAASERCAHTMHVHTITHIHSITFKIQLCKNKTCV